MKLFTATIIISIISAYAQKPEIPTVQFEYEGNTLEIDQLETTLEEFNEFIEATSYQTSAEMANQSYALVNGAFKMIPEVNWRHDIKGKLIDFNVYDSLPVGRISPIDAEKYCNWRGKRVPTKQEWEYAAAGNEKYKYSGDNRVSVIGWFTRNSWDKLHKTGLKKPNKLGLYDMSGNIAEIIILKKDNKYFAKGGSFFNDKEMLEISGVGFEVDSKYSFPSNGIRCIKSVK